MKTLPDIAFIILVSIALFSCSKSNDADPFGRYTGTYLVKRNTEAVDPSTGNHGFAKDSFLLTVGKSTTGSETIFFSQEAWTVVLNKNSFVIKPYSAKRAYFGPLTSVTGSGSFKGDSIFYTENLNEGGTEVLLGKSQCVGVRQ